jgi:putative nucleotidyltransferase with HDIG domain
VIKSDMFSTVAFLNCFSGIINGFFTSFLLLGFISIAEVLFRYTSDLRLIELSNLEVPLLQEFLEKAPGSYQHSILVGRLAESASKEIGANSILARVGAYYHDIGKIGKPLYFVENQSSKVNKHAKLTPNMSALILISHVKEGVELAKKYKLGDELIDIIQQHHGTSLIKFFYKKALEVNEGKVKEAIDEKNFRYPGPKPRTKEAGIIMLADVVEAASRTLHEPTPSRIRGLVKNLIESVLNDGQLDECRLTLKELTIIRESFTNTLNSIFHQRIEYPKDDNSDSANKSK